jgi:D-amino-acid dehydrogenase
MSNKVTIIGGGIIGLCSAFYLHKAGYTVTVIEQGDITDGTSFGNAGYVSPSHFVPLATPGIVAQGLRWMLSASSPFYIKPSLNPDLIRWCFTFWRQCKAKIVEKNIPPLHNILQLSRELTVDIKNELGNRFDLQELGCFMLYKSATVEKHELELAEEAQRLGIETRVYNAQQVKDVEPAVEVKVRGGVLYPTDCHLHPGKLMHALKENLQQNGVQFLLHCTVTGFERNGNKVAAVLTNQGRFACEELVLANGSWLPVLGKKLGISILMQAGKGYSITYENVNRNLRYPAILVDRRVAMTPLGTALRMGGTMEISGLNSPTLIRRARAIFDAAKEYYPNLPVEFVTPEKIWYGLRPLTPDGLPYIGRHSKYANLTIAGGHAMLGVSLAAGTGKLVEEIIGGKQTSIDIAAFRPERF